MNHEENQFAVNPSQVIYSITMLDILHALERRIGKEETSTLSVPDQALLKDEFVAVLEHQLDIREYLEQAIDAWEITRNL
jgi:hypothetical protein